jgi:hypothetical protein
MEEEQAKEKRTKGKTMVRKTLHQRLKIKQPEPPLKAGMNSGAPELRC